MPIWLFLIADFADIIEYENLTHRTKSSYITENNNLKRLTLKKTMRSKSTPKRKRGERQVW